MNHSYRPLLLVMLLAGLTFFADAGAAKAQCLPGPMYLSCIQQQEEQERAQQQREQQEEQERAQQQRQQQEEQERAQQQREQQEEQERAQQQRQQQEERERAQQQREQQEERERAQQQREQQEERERAQQQRETELPEHSSAAENVSRNKPVGAAVTRTTHSNLSPDSAGERATGTAPREADRSVPNTVNEQSQTKSGTSTTVQSAHPITVDPTTRIVVTSDHKGFVINHRNGDGTRIVLHSWRLGQGERRVVAYRETKDSETGKITRVYTDGRRITVGKDFAIRSSPHELTIITHKDGLREAFLPSGRPVFKERYGIWRNRLGHQERGIFRTIYTDGRAPFVQIYTIVPYDYDGVVIYQYEPVVFAPEFYNPFFQPFGTPLIVGPTCPLCPPSVIAFAPSVTTYTDPVTLLADDQIAAAINDGMNDQSAPYSGPPPNETDEPSGDAIGEAPAPDPAPQDYLPPTYDSQMQDLSQQVTTLQQQVQSAEADNEDLRSQLADQEIQTANLQQQVSMATSPTVPIQVPEAVRQQVRSEVKQDIGLHQKKRPLSLSDVVRSSDARHYVFQVGEEIDTVDQSSDDLCALSTGDLLGFDELPSKHDASAQMKVITSKPGSCDPGSRVQISLADLQNMLNGFSQRLENNMKKVHDQVAAK